MTSVYKLCNIVDSQLEDITSEVTLPVITGATNSTYQSFNAQSNGVNTSAVQFNIQVPNMGYAVSRHILIQNTITLKIDFLGDTGAAYWPNNQVLFNYGLLNSLQAFPFNALLSTSQATINNAQVSVNTRDVMASLLKLYNYDELARYNSLTPSLIDSFYSDFRDGLGSNNNVLGNYSVGGFAKEYQPRGCFPVSISGAAPVNNVPGVPLANNTVKASGTGAAPYASIYLTFTSTEPLLFLSPFISGNSTNVAAFIGLNTLNLNLNLGDASRVMSNASWAIPTGTAVSVPTIKNVSLVSVNSSSLLLNFLTIPPSLACKIEPRNVVNYNNYMPYPSGTTQSIAARVGGVNGTQSVTSNNFQLGQIPSKMLIFATKSVQTTYDSNSFAVINSINMTFANKSGILSGAKQVQLYDISIRNGLNLSVVKKSYCY